MLLALLVGFLACGLGGILRFAFSLRWNQNKTFPTGTFIANVFGSALLEDGVLWRPDHVFSF